MRTVSGERVQESIIEQELGVLSSELSRSHVKLASNASLTTSKKNKEKRNRIYICRTLGKEGSKREKYTLH